MDLGERLGWLVLGMAVGFVLGFIVARLRVIEQKVDEVDGHVKHRARDEIGFMRVPIIADAMVLIVVLITAWAAFASQKATNDVHETQQDLAEVTLCNQQYLKSQAEFLAILLEVPPPSNKEKREALTKYYELLTAYAEADNNNTPAQNFNECLSLGDKLEETTK